MSESLHCKNVDIVASLRASLKPKCNSLNKKLFIGQKSQQKNVYIITNWFDHSYPVLH